MYVPCSAIEEIYGGGADTEGVRAEAQVENSKGIALILSSRAAPACRRRRINAIPLESSTSFLSEERNN